MIKLFCVSLFVLAVVALLSVRSDRGKVCVIGICTDVKVKEVGVYYPFPEHRFYFFVPSTKGREI